MSVPSLTTSRDPFAHLLNVSTPLIGDVRLADPVDHSVWFPPDSAGTVATYHMATLPARMAGGEVCSHLTARNAHGEEIDIPFSSPGVEGSLSWLLDAAAIGPITLCGLGPVNVVPHGIGDAGGWETNLLTLLMLYAGACVWIFPCNDRAGDLAFVHLARMAGGILVFTQYQAEIIRSYEPNGPVVVMPPCLDLSELRSPIRRPPTPVLLGFGGSPTKYAGPDFQMVLPTMWNLAARPDVDVAFWGYTPEDGPGRYPFGTGGGSVILHNGETNYLDYLSAISSLDIAISPLTADNPLPVIDARGRWQGHWLDHAIFGTPIVVSDLPPYDEFEDGVTVLKASSEAEWREALTALVDDAALRHRMGQAAREEAMRNYTTEAAGPRWRAWYASAAHRHDELERNANASQLELTPAAGEQRPSRDEYIITAGQRRRGKKRLKAKRTRR